jgi:hypothetical protein
MPHRPYPGQSGESNQSLIANDYPGIAAPGIMSANKPVICTVSQPSLEFLFFKQIFYAGFSIDYKDFYLIRDSRANTTIAITNNVSQFPLDTPGNAPTGNHIHVYVCHSSSTKIAIVSHQSQ